MLVEILRRVTTKRFHPPVGRTKFQKLAYFATAAGLPTGLEFARRSYGPYAEELKPQLTRLVNNGLLEEEQLGRMFASKPGRTFDDAYKARGNELRQWTDISDRVADLMMRMDTDEAELAATVHFAFTELRYRYDELPTESAVLEEVLEWKSRRRPPLDAERVASTVRNLNWLGWIDAKPSDLPLSEDPLLAERPG
jgi:hypothetical protein